MAVKGRTEAQAGTVKASNLTAKGLCLTPSVTALSVGARATSPRIALSQLTKCRVASKVTNKPP